ncbi:bcl-2-modifying factor isoform X2 [Paroedura picta]|uniref:bcl-2-modifying factor isoform X2 n=1 Tax=Paroedura picta TaxID=143630 RepID=UPI0040565EE3
MDPPGYLEDDFSSLDGLDDDVFHADDCGLASQPNEITFPGIFTQSQSYSCLLGRFQLFPLTHCCGPGTRHAKQQDKATQTLSPSSSSQDIMLPCGVTEQPQRLFYGNAGYRLHANPSGFSLNPHLQEEPQESPEELRTEVQIARKLQCIADQFHRLHLQRHLSRVRSVKRQQTKARQQKAIPARPETCGERMKRYWIPLQMKHQQNRNHVWWQILLFLHNVALNMEANRHHAGRR